MFLCVVFLFLKHHKHQQRLKKSFQDITFLQDTLNCRKLLTNHFCSLIRDWLVLAVGSHSGQQPSWCSFLTVTVTDPFCTKTGRRAGPLTRQNWRESGKRAPAFSLAALLSHLWKSAAAFQEISVCFQNDMLRQTTSSRHEIRVKVSLFESFYNFR